MNSKDLFASQNFNFIAFCLAKMNLDEKKVNISGITANMSPENGVWFQRRYEHYLQQLQSRRCQD